MLQKSKWITLGLVVGLLLSVSVQGLAATYQYVTAINNDQVSFVFDGEEKSLPKEFTSLFYEDRLYLPIRFIADELGFEIKWHEEIRQVEIISADKEGKEPSLPVETTENESKEETETPKDESKYEVLPQTNYVGKSLVTLKDLTILDKERTLISLEVNNTGEIPVQLNQSASKLIVNGKEFHQNDVSENISTKFDFTWYQDILEDEKRQGTITLPGIPTETKYAELHLKLLDNDGSGKEHDLVYYIKLK